MLKLPRTACGAVRAFPTIRCVRFPASHHTDLGHVRPYQLERRTRGRQLRIVAMSGEPKTAMSAQQLQQQYGIEGSVEIVEGNGGLPKVVMRHACGSSAEVYLFGACITSWSQASGNEILYIRPDAVWDKSKAISGGIPICWPQFGPGELQQHGFARNLDWELTSTSADPQPDEPDPQIELVLTDTEQTQAVYPHSFKVVFTITLHNETLKTVFRVINTGSTDLSFTGALHGYYELAHISKAKVHGLQGLTYLDKIPDSNNPVEKVLEDEVMVFNGPVDSVFLSAPDSVDLDVGTGAAISLTNKNWKECVCWNPYMDMPDFYEQFCCVENANFDPVEVKAGQSWVGETEYVVKNL